MDELNVTQTILSSKTGIHQPTISRFLSGKDSSCFSVTQLVLVASVLETTPDELLGIKEKKSKKIKNLGEIAEFLFDISKVLDIGIEKITINASPNDRGAYSKFVDDCVKDRYAVYFENKHLDTLIKNWGAISNSILDDQCRKEVIETWEAAKIKELQKCDSEYSFLTYSEKIEQLCEIFDPYGNHFTQIPYFVMGDEEMINLISESDLSMLLDYGNSNNLMDSSLYREINDYKNERKKAIKRLEDKNSVSTINDNVSLDNNKHSTC